MEVENIFTHPRFDKSYKKLPEEIKTRAKNKEKKFRGNPFHPSLRTHKLTGREREVWAFWIDYHYRIKFIFLDDGEVLFLDIGSHKIYK